jgi:hypothetical protein
MNAQREVIVNTDALYGQKFAFASAETIKNNIQALTPPTLSNILAISSLAIHKPGAKYTAEEIHYLFRTALAGFAAIIDFVHSKNVGDVKRPIILHTGNWGCGAFGGSVIMMTLIQLFSARLAGLHRMVYHTVDPYSAAQCEIAYKHYKSVWSKVAADGAMKISLNSLVQQLLDLNLGWNQSNGT